MPAFNEKSIGEGVYAADENNDRNSARGTFVRSGGAVTPGASSTEVSLNADAVDIRVGGTDYSAASGSVTLAANSTAYPRRDLVVAEKGPTTSDPASFSVLTGDPIDQETNDTLVNAGVIEGSGSPSPGYPIHPAANIPEIQPPPAQGLREQATVLAMVYVPPGTADSTALSGDLITDLRMEGIGVSDVLRAGDAVDEIESHGDPINATVSNSEALGGESVSSISGRAMTLSTGFRELADTDYDRTILNIPKAGNSVELWSIGVHIGDGSANVSGVAAQFGPIPGPEGAIDPVSGGTTTDVFDGAGDAPRATVGASETVALDCKNNSGAPLWAEAHANVIYRGN